MGFSLCKAHCLLTRIFYVEQVYYDGAKEELFKTRGHRGKLSIMTTISKAFVLTVSLGMIASLSKMCFSGDTRTWTGLSVSRWNYRANCRTAEACTNDGQILRKDQLDCFRIIQGQNK